MNTTTPPTTRMPLYNYTVEAKLVHAFAEPFTKYKDWINYHLSISRAIAGSQRWRHIVESGHLVSVDAEGKERMRMDYAYSLARKFPSFTGAILTISICENLGDGQIGDSDSVEDELANYQCLAYLGDKCNPRLLHEYLGVEEDYKPWIKRQISKFKMQNRIDYFKASPGNKSNHGIDLIITLPNASLIAQYEDTRRSEQIRICTNMPVKIGKVLGFDFDELEVGFKELSELLLTAEARHPRSSKKRKSATKSSLI